MPVITSGGIVRDRRVHVYSPWDWGHAAGSDFWLICNDVDMVPGGAVGLENYGWISAGFSYLAGTGADFLSSSDVGTTGGFNFDVAQDTLVSPFIFGDYAHLTMVEDILGYTPTTLNAEFYMRLAANNDEQASGAGFFEQGTVAPLTKAETMACIGSGGTNFEIHSGAAEDSGSTDDTSPHVFKITATSGSTFEWWIDGTSQGTLAIQDDLWPAAFGVGTQAAGTNDPVLSWAHVWYA